MKVEDGGDDDVVVRCVGFAPEVKCSFVEKSVDLGSIPICRREERHITLKNNFKYPAVFHVQMDKLPAYVDVQPTKGRLIPEHSCLLKVIFMGCKDQREMRDEKIIVNLRGGKPLIVPFSVNVVVPKIRVEQDKFEFGSVITLGNSAKLEMTLVNESNIRAVLILDLREKEDTEKGMEGIECLDVIAAGRHDEMDESSMMISISDTDNVEEESTAGGRRNRRNRPSEDDDDEMAFEEQDQEEDDDDDDDQHHAESSRFYKIFLKPHATANFELKFTPKTVKNYQLELPLILAGFGKMESLCKPIFCKGLKPRFLMEPHTIEFRKKIITSSDKCVPSFLEITISNPDAKSIFWKFDPSQLGAYNKVFQIIPFEGRIDGGSTTIIKASFNPLIPDLYCQSVNLYLDGDESKPYMTVEMKGEGAFPRLLFDRREIILPVVPLGIASRCIFRIFNDGYENLNLKYQLPQEEVRHYQLEVLFIEGTNLGITKNKIRLEAKFFSEKPVSFSSRLEFYDESGAIYPISISGTADNCLLTNFTYLLRNLNDFTITAEENKPIMLAEQMFDEDDDLESEQAQKKQQQIGRSYSQAGSVISGKSNKSILGYNPVKQVQLDQACEYVQRWLQNNALNNGIQMFPEDMIKTNGQQLFELIQFLSSRTPPNKLKIEPNLKRQEKITLVVQQYGSIIRYLKEQGALLNTIRPQYLLSYSDFIFYLKITSNEGNQASMRITNYKFKYISYDSWLTIFFQIMKIYYLSRINSKILKGIPNLPADANNLPDYYLESSNILSSQEIILLRWMELNDQLIRPQRKDIRLRNFDTDLRDCRNFASLIQNYVGGNTFRMVNQMKPQCASEEDYRFNCERLIGLLSEIGITTCQSRDFFDPSQRENILFCIQLAHNLPHYQPRGAPIQFTCTLNEEVIKHIELTNPTARLISYYVKIEGPGANDFTLESETVKLEPKSTVKYKVIYFARISDKVTARITFTNKREGNASAAALVFDIESNVINRQSVETHYIKAKLYQTDMQFQIPVKNIFSNQSLEQGEFFIKLIHDPPVLYNQQSSPQQQDATATTNTKQDKKSNKQNNQNQAPQQQLQQEEVIPAFFCMKDKIKLRKNLEQSLQLYFTPFQYAKHICYIVFQDKNIGEFQHTVIGETDLPDFISELKPQSGVYVDVPKVIEFQLNFKNEQLANAKKQHDQRLLTSGKVKEREKLMQQKQNAPNSDQIAFEVKLQPFQPNYPNPYMFLQVPNQFTLYDKLKYGRKMKETLESTTKEKKKINSSQISEESVINQQQGQMELLNKLGITFAFKQAAREFGCCLILNNTDWTDVRVYKILTQVSPKIIRAALEMRVPAGDEITQEIPYVNTIDKDQVIKLSWAGDGLQWFQGSKDFIAKKKQTSFYQIVFKPSWILKCECQLTLKNEFTNEVFEYDLIGIGEEPLAKDHIILNCIARHPTIHKVAIHNGLEKEMQLKVETDLMNPEGPPEIRIKAQETYNYPLTITPILGGMYTGSIMFYYMEPEEFVNRYFWYTIMVNTQRPKAEKTIDLFTVIRKAAAFDISLSNPLKELVTFEVIIEGEGLIGEQSFKLQPLQTATYELLFSPLRQFKSKGSIAFIHEKLGEIWYELNLQADETPVMKVPTMKAELGKVEQYECILENPSNMEVRVVVRLSNPNNFDVSPDNFTIPPYSSINTFIRYIPSDLDANEFGEVIFESDTIGRWHYVVYGTGLPPTKYDEKIIAGTLNKDFSSMIVFKNPFKDSITVLISLEADERATEVFALLIKKTKCTVPGMGTLQIPYSFTPKEISSFSGEIVVFMNEKIQWRYPLRGITESFSTAQPFIFKAKAREVLDNQQLRINLPGLPKDIAQNPNNHFTVSFDNIPKEIRKSFGRIFRLEPVKKQLSGPDDELIYNVRLAPMKPFKLLIDLLINISTGGRWKYKLQLESAEPDVDDIITIYSPLNKTASVSFKLTNRYKSTAQFTAFFSADSDPEFQVLPKTGELLLLHIILKYRLQQSGKEGNTFIISFTPVEYGQPKKGKLIIQTDELYWSYIVRGTFPQYRPPSVMKSQIENRLETQYEDQLKQMSKRNFILENIEQSKMFKEFSPKSIYKSQKILKSQIIKK